MLVELQARRAGVRFEPGYGAGDQRVKISHRLPASVALDFIRWPETFLASDGRRPPGAPSSPKYEAKSLWSRNVPDSGKFDPKFQRVFSESAYAGSNPTCPASQSGLCGAISGCRRTADIGRLPSAVPA